MTRNNSAWPAPAKLNLLLNITNRRADGYHELQTVFQFLDQADSLNFSVTGEDRIHCEHHLNGVAAGEDLVYRAAMLLKTHTGYRGGAHIHLQKVLPMGGGLGGGSSDAATTLAALNHLWGTGLNQQELADLGLTLGADIPIFIHGRATWAEGVGEVFTPLDLPEPWFLVIHPGIHVSTKEIFCAPELTRHAAPIKIRDFFAGATFNLCEPVVRSRYPQVDAAMAWLGRHGEARMTGTGACIFMELRNRDQGQNILQELPVQWRGFVAKGLNRSPLLDRLQQAGGNH